MQVALIAAKGTPSPVASGLVLIWSMVGLVAHDCGGGDCKFVEQTLVAQTHYKVLGVFSTIN